MDEPEDEDIAASEAWRPRLAFNHDRLTKILTRRSEIAAASKKGRQSAAVKPMNSFDDCFHTVLNTPAPAHGGAEVGAQVGAHVAQLSYGRPDWINTAPQHQYAGLKEMRTFDKRIDNNRTRD